MTKEQKNDFDQFNDLSEVKSNWVKFGKIGDYIKGTLVEVREITSQLPGKEGQKVKVYEFLTHIGSFHEMDNDKKPVEPPVEVKEGEYWTVGGKDSIDNQMRNVKIGQIVGMRFTETKPSKNKGFAAQKIIKVYVGGMDPNYMGQTAAVSSTE